MMVGGPKEYAHELFRTRMPGLARQFEFLNFKVFILPTFVGNI